MSKFVFFMYAALLVLLALVLFQSIVGNTNSNDWNNRNNTWEKFKRNQKRFGIPMSLQTDAAIHGFDIVDYINAGTEEEK